MPTRIDNITEAQEAVAALGDFLERFRLTLGTLGSLAGKSNGIVKLPHRASLDHAGLVTAVRQKVLVIAPETMPERVLAILKEAPDPMTPKQMVDRYTALGWPAPKSGKLYSALLASAYYLRKKKGILKSDRGKYSIVAVENESKT